MLNDSSLTFSVVSAAGLTMKATYGNPPTALEGAKATSLTAGRPPAITNQAPNPTGPPLLTTTNNHRRYQCISMHLRHKSATKDMTLLKTRRRRSWPSTGCENDRVRSLKDGEGEIRTTPQIGFVSRSSSPLKYQVCPYDSDHQDGGSNKS